MCNYCNRPICCCPEGNNTQSTTNKTIYVPVAPLTEYDWAKSLGLIPEDMTPLEFINRPAGSALGVTEVTQEW